MRLSQDFFDEHFPDGRRARKASYFTPNYKALTVVPLAHKSLHSIPLMCEGIPHGRRFHFATKHYRKPRATSDFLPKSAHKDWRRAESQPFAEVGHVAVFLLRTCGASMTEIHQRTAG